MPRTNKRRFLVAGMIGSRGRTILHTGAWALVARICAAINLFISISIALSALGPLRFGAWATLTSLVTFSNFLDFGFGNGTMNLIAAANARSDNNEVRAILSEGVRTLCRVALGLAAASACALLVVPWHKLLGLPETLTHESLTASAIVLGAVTISVPLNLATRVQLGLGRGDRAFRWQAIGHLVGLGLIAIVANIHPTLSGLIAAAISGPLFGATANSILLQREPTLRNKLGGDLRRPDIARAIKHEGMMFFILQLAAALAYSSDLPLISMFRGASEAGHYAIVQRLYSIIPLGLGLVWTPLWPIYRQALASGNHIWLRRTLKRSALAATGAACTLGVMLALGFHIIIGIWVSQPIRVSGWLLGGFFSWVTIDALGTSIATFLNAASIMRFQIVLAMTFSLLCVTAKSVAIVFAGIKFLPWVTVGLYTTISLIPTLIFLPKLIDTAFGRRY